MSEKERPHVPPMNVGLGLLPNQPVYVFDITGEMVKKYRDYDQFSRSKFFARWFGTPDRIVWVRRSDKNHQHVIKGKLLVTHDSKFIPSYSSSNHNPLTLDRNLGTSNYFREFTQPKIRETAWLFGTAPCTARPDELAYTVSSGSFDYADYGRDRNINLLALHEIFSGEGFEENIYCHPDNGTRPVNIPTYWNATKEFLDQLGDLNHKTSIVRSWLITHISRWEQNEFMSLVVNTGNILEKFLLMSKKESPNKVQPGYFQEFDKIIARHRYQPKKEDNMSEEREKKMRQRYTIRETAGKEQLRYIFKQSAEIKEKLDRELRSTGN